MQDSHSTVASLYESRIKFASQQEIKSIKKW